jgi:serine/threonine protein kinase
MRKPHNMSKHDFTVLKQLGSGKFSKVYMVRERKTGFLAAMKCVTKEKIWRENLQNQILR